MINPTFATRNLIRSAEPTPSTISALYYTNNSMFDVILETVDCLSLIKTSKSHSLIDQIEYDCVISSDPIELTDMVKHIKNLHMKPILFMHNPLPKFFKKEDRYLLSEALSGTPSCCMTMAAYIDSLMKTSAYIEYGLPTFDINKNKRKSILIINTKKNDKLSSIFQMMKNIHNDAEMITSFADISLNDTISIFNDYAVVLALDNYIDILSALSCGCSCVTNLEMQNYAVNSIKDFRNIESTLNHLIYGYNVLEHISVSSNIQNNYPIKKFQQKIELFIKNSITG
jgi:hypothetical protein